MKYTKEEALERLETLCARAEHCEGEMRLRLRKWGLGSSESDEIIDSLKRDKFVDDARFARAYAREKCKFAKWGRLKIRRELLVKGVKRDLVDEALLELDEGEYNENLESIIKAKVKNNPGLLSTFEGRTKLYRFALSRGFESGSISAAMKRLMRNE